MSSAASGMTEWSARLSNTCTQLLDKTAPYKLYRWLFLVVLVALYIARVFSLRGFYIVTYALGMYNWHLVLGFITPSTDPELEGPVLPRKSDDEFRPFVRRLQEMKFWTLSSRSFSIGLVATLFPFLDVPVFWPILLFYWIAMICITLEKQIRHMIKYKYLPWSFWKKRRYQDGG